MKHPLCMDARTQSQKDDGEHQVEVRLLSFGDFSVNLRANVWCNDPYKAIRMHSDINKVVDSEGVGIPFSYRTIVNKKDLPANAKYSRDE